MPSISSSGNMRPVSTTQQGVAVLQNHHVLADGPQSAQGYDFERLSRHGWGSSLRVNRTRSSPGAFTAGTDAVPVL